jgi:hypothetical protein
MSAFTPPVAQGELKDAPSPLGLRYDRRLLAAATLLALPVGLAVGLHPAAVVLVAVLVAAAALSAFAPVHYLPAVLLAGTIIEPTLVLKGVSGAGQAHLVIAIAVIALVRVLVARPKLTVPALFPLALATALFLTLMMAAIASGKPAGTVGSLSAMSRDLSFPFAAIVGIIGGVRARDSQRWLTIPRMFAALGIAASLACVDYWLWAKHGTLPLSSGLFGEVKAQSPFPVSRSIFPWVEDAPNLGAVTFVLIAAFAAPPLLLAPARRDRVLALILVITSVAAVLATQSRTGIVALVTGSVAYLVLVRRGGGRRSRVVATLLLAAAVSGYVFSTFPAERASSDNLAAREFIWGQAAHAFLNSPIIGHGYLYSQSGNFVEAAAKNGTTTSQTVSTHSDWLSVLVDGGVVGLTLFVTIIMLMVRAALRGFRDPRSIPIAIGFLCLLVTFVTGGVDNTPTQSAAIPTIEWLTFGLMVGLTPSAVGKSLGAARQPRRAAPVRRAFRSMNPDIRSTSR